MARILKGGPVAAALGRRAEEDVRELAAVGITPTLAIVRVGERQDDLSYERGAVKRCEAFGVQARSVPLCAQAKQADLMATLERLDADESVHGILMLRPLPAHFDERAACEAIAPEKDVDGAGSASAALVYAGEGRGFAPCTAQACMELFAYYGIDLRGKHAVVLGRSLVIGRPLALMMMGADATVTLCHSKSGSISRFTRYADIVVAAIGRAEAVPAHALHAGQVVVDVGVNWSEEKGCLCGDVPFEEAEPLVEAITPVPGGVGGVTTAVLASNVIQAAKRAAGKAE